MDLDDLFISRLKLIVIMAEAYLDGFPLGEHRRQAILENAHHITQGSIALGGLNSGAQHDCNPLTLSSGREYDHVFYQRVKLLAVMVTAVAKGFPMGENRKAAMRENLESICQTLLFDSQSEDMAFIKVA
ncbi:MAG: hypothetical protein WAU91_14435 [Desulfatitalea sp.]